LYKKFITIHGHTNVKKDRRTHHKVQASAGKADMAAGLLQSPDVSEDVVLVAAAWSCWVDFRDTSVCQDLLRLGAAGRGKPAVSQVKSPSVLFKHLCLESLSNLRVKEKSRLPGRNTR
jgi:hypothetical protein